MNRLKNLDWPGAVFSPLAAILMEACWVYPWLLWVGIWPVFTRSRPALSLASVIIIMVISWLLTGVSVRQKWPIGLVRGITIGGGLAAAFLVLRMEYGAGYALLDGQWLAYLGHLLGNTLTAPSPAVVALPVWLYLWWRGITLGRTTSYSGNIYRSFLFGMVALVILLVLWQLSTTSGTFERPGAGAGFYVMAFFFFGLLAVTLRHLHRMRRSMPREEAALTSVWRWLPIMLGAIGGMVVAGFVVALAFSAEFFTGVEQGTRAIGGTLGKLLHYIMVPFNYLFDGIFYLLQLVVNWLRGDHMTRPGISGNMTFPGMTEITPKELPPEATLAIKWVVMTLIAAAVIYFLMRAVSRYRAEHVREEIEEIHESVWSGEAFRDDLRQLFRAMGDKFKRTRTPPAAPGYRIDGNASGRLNIREIYRHLLWEGVRSGMPRRQHETAGEYGERLGQAVPDGREQLTRLTDLYTGVRYGDIPAREEQIDRANSLWQALRRLWRRGG